MALMSEELKKIARKVLHRIPGKRVKNKFMGFPNKTTLSKELEQLIGRYGGERFFWFPSPSCPWGYMFQRPQQLARALSQKGYLVLYSVDTSFPGNPDWSVRGLYHLEDNIYLFNDGVGGEVLSQFAENMIIWQYWPHQLKTIEKISNDSSIKIMDCIDHLSTFISYKSISEDYQSSIKEADIALATSSSIYEEVVKIKPDCLLVPNAVNINDFSTSSNYKMSAKEMDIFYRIKLLKENNISVIGYYGAIAEWIDYELIEEVSKENKSWQFVFIGEKYPDISLPSSTNIHFYERVTYDALLSIVNLFDVAILPFKINDITTNTSPVKIFEYMAARKPVVSTPLPESLKYEPIFVAKDSKDFALKIGKAIRCSENREYLILLEKCAENNTWATRVDQVIFELQKELCEKSET